MAVGFASVGNEEGQRRGLIHRSSAVQASFEYLDTEDVGFCLFKNAQTADEHAQVAP